MLKDQEPEWSKSTTSMWEYRVEKPSNTLKNWVCSYGGYCEDVGQPVCRLEVPKDRVVLILGFRKQLQISSTDSKKLKASRYEAFVVGLGEKPLLVEHAGTQRGIEIELFPWTVHRLFGVAAKELVQEVVHLKDLWGNHAHLLVEQLSEMSSWQERFTLVNRVLTERFALSNRIIRQEIEWAWSQLEQHKGCIPIRQLAASIGWSDRHFATCFREHIGITPKAAAQRIRFNHAQRLLKSADNYALSEIAAICGYSDQSHLTREFYSFSQCSPGIYRKAQFEDLLGTPGDVIQPEVRSNLFKT